jgi:glycosyltransferase involved in cell wall biosynthesis
MKRATYICADPGIPLAGSKGASIHVREVVGALARRGWDVSVFTTDRGPAPEGRFAVHPFGRIGGDGAARERACLAANEALSLALDGAQAPDLLYERYSLWNYAAMEHARRRGIPGVLEVNAPLVEEQARHRSLHDRDAAERVAERAIGAAAVLVAVSSEVAGWLDRFPGAAAKTHVVPNGVDPSRFRPSARRSRPAVPGGFVVGFVGSLKPWHGLENLAGGFARLHSRRPAARLLIVGGGPGRERLAGDLDARGVLAAVDWAGTVPAEDVPGLLCSMDVAVVPYPAGDGFYFSPLKLFEAMAAGLPVVASGTGQLAEVVRHDVTGLLCRPGDDAELAAALERLHDDPTLRMRLGRAARRRVLEAHTWDRTVERIVTLAREAPLRRVA